MFRRKNLAARVFERQISSPAPGTSVNRARRFYENIVPSNATRVLRCPEVFWKFTDDGNFLISFGISSVDVYKPNWLTFSCRGDNCRLPCDTDNFESFFTQLCTVSLPTNSEELIVRDFFLYSEKNQLRVFATANLQVNPNAPAAGDAIPGIPAIRITTIHVVRLKDGKSLDMRSFYDDYIALKGNDLGVHLYDDLVAIVSLRYQKIHILQISDSGTLELLRTSSYQDMDILGRDNFDLIIWKVQFLDRHHLLIQFGSVAVVMQRNRDDPNFFAVYNMETTQTISFNQDSADELYTLFELFCDHFHSWSKNSFLSTHSNNIYALERLKYNENQARNRVQFVENMLATLPFKCQSRSPSPYFDHSLFRYDEKLISATYRLRYEYTVREIEFSLRRQPSTPFKITSGNSDEPESWKKFFPNRSSFLFHPFLPLAISVRCLPTGGSSVKVHYR